MNGIGKKTLKRFIHDFEGFSKDAEVANTTKAVAEGTNDFNLPVVWVTLRSSEQWVLRN